MTGLEFVGPASGRWLQEEVTAVGGSIQRLVPDCFRSSARVLHRIDPDGLAIRWAEVCAASGATAHPLMQWDLISRSWAGQGSLDQGRSADLEPRMGSLDPISMAALYDTLASATSVIDVFHGFWNGGGGLAPGSASWLTDKGSVDAPQPAFPFPMAVIDGPLLELPERQYLVFTGDLDPGQFAARPGSFFWPQSPGLSWPADHAWCVATEIDFDSTVVAGSPELIDAILAHTNLEAWLAGARDSLQLDGDLINPNL